MNDWPTEAEIKAMFPRKEGFGADVTLSVAMQLPEVRALVDALTLIVRAHDLRESYHALPNDHHRIGEKRSPKGHAREAWLRAFRKSAKAAAAALAAIKDPKI